MTKNLFFAFVFLALGSFVAGNASAVGMITEPIVVSNMLRGGEIIKTVTVFNPEEKTEVFELGSEGAIKGWVEFFETGKPDAGVTQFNVPAKSFYDLAAKIKVPQDAPNGEYAGEIYVKQLAKQAPTAGESSVSVGQMVSLEVTIKVTDQELKKLAATLIPETFDVKSGAPLKIKIIYENQGNVALKPDFQIKVTSLADEKTVFNAIYPYAETEEAVRPGERKTLPVFEWPTASHPNGRYQVKATSLVAGEILDENEFRFSIGPGGVGGEVLGTFIAKIGAGNQTFGWIVAVGILALIVFLAIFLIKNLIKKLRAHTKI